MTRKKYTEEFGYEQVDSPPANAQIDWQEEVMKLHIWIAVSCLGAVALTGCAAGGGADKKPNPFAGCDEVFAPEPTIAELTAEVLDVWSQATGKNLCLSDQGTPVRLLPTVIDEADGQPLCGTTDVDYFNNSYVFYVAISDSNLDGRCISRRQTLTHEIGHAISHTPYGKAYHLPDNKYGVMSALPNSLTVPNQLDKDLVCRYSDCYY